MAGVAVCFDLELDGNVILCAATAWTNGLITVPQLWSQQTRSGFVPLNESTLEALIISLHGCYKQGIALVTWGGTGSDWKALYNAARLEIKPLVKEMALHSIDIPLISSAANGMMMGLTSAALGMGMGHRPACESQDVPAFWNSGDVKKQNEVLLHVQWDAGICANIYNHLYAECQVRRPMLTWITKKGETRYVRLQRVRTISGAHELPRIEDILQWGEPVCNFPIPDSLHPKTMLKWLM